MKVKIGAEVYDAGETPIMLILTEQDRENIRNMNPDATKYCAYPEGMDSEEIERWMSMPPTERTKEGKAHGS